MLEPLSMRPPEVSVLQWSSEMTGRLVSPHPFGGALLAATARTMNASQCRCRC